MSDSPPPDSGVFDGEVDCKENDGGLDGEVIATRIQEIYQVPKKKETPRSKGQESSSEEDVDPVPPEEAARDPLLGVSLLALTL